MVSLIFTLELKFGEIWGSEGDNYEDYGLWGCDAV